MPSHPLAPSTLPESWLRGVATNPAAPAEVLLRLLAPQASVAWTVLCGTRALPSNVVEAVLVHPERAVRCGFAHNRYASPEQRGRLVDDPDAFVRAALAGGPRPALGAVPPLPDVVLEALLTARDDREGQMLTADEIRQELVFSGQIQRSFRLRSLHHPNPELRTQAAVLWPWLTPGQREGLLHDPDPTVSEAARRWNRILDPAAMEAELPENDGHHRNLLLINYAVSRTVAERCLAQGRDLWSLASNPHTPADIVDRLARDPDPKVRERIAARADLSPALLAELAEDPSEAVRTRALLQPLPRTWPQRAVLDQVIGHTAESIGLLGEMFLEPETSWYEANAVSEHPQLRRVAATCARLPEVLVRRLAADPDPEVRHLLALNHPLAPPAIVLDAFLAAPLQRPYLLTLSRLPRTGLGHLLGHPDPEVRALAAADTSPAEPPTRSLADPDPCVRRAAASNPLLPLDLLSSLLEDPADLELAEAAAANPALPAGRLHELLDRSGLRATAP